MTLIPLTPQQVSILAEGAAAMQRHLALTAAAASDATFAPLLNQEESPDSGTSQAEQAGMQLAGQLIANDATRARLDAAVLEVLTNPEVAAPEIADKARRLAAGEGGLIAQMVAQTGGGLLGGPDIVIDPGTVGGPAGGAPSRDTVCCKCILGLIVLTAALDCLPCVAAGGYAYFIHCA